MMRQSVRLIFVAMLSLAGAGLAQDLLRKQVMVLAPGDSTTFLFTNQTTAFYYGEAGRLNSSAFQGFNVLTQEYFEDYLLQFDGQILDRRNAEVLIFPNRLVRRYSPQQICEEVFLLDSLNALLIKILSPMPGELTLIPGFAGSRQPQDYELRWEQEFSMLCVGQRALMEVGEGRRFPAWTAVASPAAGFAPFAANECSRLSKLFVSPTFVPGCLQVALRDSVMFYVMVGSDAKELLSVRSYIDGHLEHLLDSRHGGLENVLERGNLRIDRSDVVRPSLWTSQSPGYVMPRADADSTGHSVPMLLKQDN